MSLPGQLPHQVRFGDFEVDLETGELCRKGRKFTLQGQPFQVLAILLERPGQLVTREELRNKLWPSDTFVDFDHSLNKAVNRLREALMDAAENPRFIETLPRRGYRWIGNAIWASPPLPHASADAKIDVEPSAPCKVEDAKTNAAPVLRVGKAWAIRAAVAVALIGGGFLYFRHALPAARVVNIVQITHDRVPKLAVVTDGSRLYINETLGAKQILVQASASGGETSVIPTPFANVALYDISPDHSQLLVADTLGTTHDVPLWSFPLAAGVPRRLGDVIGHFGAWSDDGRQLAFAKGFDIYVAGADGSNIRRVATVTGSATWLRFSPDGTRIRFTLINPNNNTSSLWEVSADGSNLHSLLPGRRSPPAEDGAGMWSPDGRYYFFVSAAIQDVPSIWAVRESAWLSLRPRPRPARLTSGPMFFGPFVPSVDGQKLFGDGWLLRGELVRYSKKERQFQPFFSDISITDLDFSRDGRWVAYVTWPENTLWRSRVDGTERLQLTFLPIVPYLPRWSPDGSRIAYIDRGPGHLFKLCLVSRDGGASHDLLPEHRQQSHPDWSPDGKRIVFGRDMELKGPAEEIAIHVLDLNSKQVSMIPGSIGLYVPRWSPDGQHLAALAADSKKLRLYDFKTGKWTDWVDGVGAISFPTWSRDSQYISYDTSSKDVLAYRRSKIGQTRTELVVDLNNLRRLATWSGVAPDGSPLFIRDVSADDIYALELELP